MKLIYIKHGRQFLVVFLVLVIVISLAFVSIIKERMEMAKETLLPIYGTDDDNMRISLTINCAWGADDIPDILDILDREQIKATFFVLGIWAEKNPEMLKLIHDRGHEIGNHSYSHKLPSRITVKQMEEEIDKANDAIEKIVGYRPVLYRAPSGDHTEELLKLTQRKGLYTIKWTVDSIDWKDSMTAQNIIDRVTGRTRSGSILLFHNDTKHTKDVLPVIIRHLKNEGYVFVKVSELIYKTDYYIDHQGIQRGKRG